MNDASKQPRDSLDGDVTRAGDLSKVPRPAASLGDLETGADLEESVSDLTDLGDGIDEAGEVVDLSQRYEITGVLGKGGMGEVVRAKDKRLERQVAIKRLLGEFSRSRKAVGRFLTEAKSVAALNHYNIVQIYDFGRDESGPFIVMELVEGESLADKLQAGPLSLEEAVEMTAQLCDALQKAHDAGIIHRDVKPSNILITAENIPKLTDFGLARRETVDSSHTQAGTVLGTLDFMPPEQRVDASQADARSDQWSLAATFYQMVTGEVPRVIDGGSIPKSVREVTLRALKTKPRDRFATSTEFGAALRSAIVEAAQPKFDRDKLQEGQCGSCGTLNDTARKFCKDCGGNLQDPCPQCTAITPVWERFCGECGADIAELLEQQVAAAQELRREVQSLRRNYQHIQAIEQLAPLLDSRHSALQAHRDWAEATRQSLTEELAKLTRQRDQLLQAAREQAEQHNDSAALKYLDQIPEPLQTDESQRFVEQLEHRRTEARTLLRKIQQAIKVRKYDDLESKLNQYLELKPNDTQARNLLRKLKRRSERKRFPDTAVPDDFTGRRDEFSNSSPDRSGFVRQVKLVAILMIVQGSLELVMGLAAGIGGPVMVAVEPQGAPPVGIFIVLGLVMGGIGASRIIAGILNLKFRGRIFGIVINCIGFLSTFTCYCAPTAIGLAIYGLIVYLNRDVAEAFSRSESQLQSKHDRYLNRH